MYCRGGLHEVLRQQVWSRLGWAVLQKKAAAILEATKSVPFKLTTCCFMCCHVYLLYSTVSLSRALYVMNVPRDVHRWQFICSLEDNKNLILSNLNNDIKWGSGKQKGEREKGGWGVLVFRIVSWLGCETPIGKALGSIPNVHSLTCKPLFLWHVPEFNHVTIYRVCPSILGGRANNALVKKTTSSLLWGRTCANLPASRHFFSSGFLYLVVERNFSPVGSLLPNAPIEAVDLCFILSFYPMSAILSDCYRCNMTPQKPKSKQSMSHVTEYASHDVSHKIYITAVIRL